MHTFNQFGQLGVAIAMCALGSRYPKDLGYLIELQEAVHAMPGNGYCIIATEVGLNTRIFLEVSMGLARKFCLTKVGAGRSNESLAWGFVRLPSNERTRRFPGRRLQFGCARFEPNVKELLNQAREFKWKE